jgi:hypothetical protein
VTHEYQLPPGPRADRLHTIDPTPDLEAEIKLCRLIAEELSATANPMVAHICSIIGRLAERDQAMKTANRAMITAEQVHVLMRWMGDMLYATALEFLPDDRASAFADRFIERFTDGFKRFRESGVVPALRSETTQPQPEPSGTSDSSASRPLPLCKLE